MNLSPCVRLFLKLVCCLWIAIVPSRADTWRRAGIGSEGRDLLGAWFANTNEGWALGTDAAAIRHTTNGGQTWSDQFTDLPSTSVLNAVWGADASHVWAVGANNLIIKWNGSVWAAESVPAASANTVLWAVWGSDANNVWAVGGDEVAGTSTIYKWNGSVWSTQTAGTGVALRGVWGSGSSSVWAVGPSGVILRWDGSSWVAQTSGTSAVLYSITGVDANNVWTVGTSGTIRKWDGSSWTAQTSNTTLTLFNVWAADATHIWATTGSKDILKWDGTSWAVQSTNDSSIRLRCVAGADAANVCVVGDNGVVVKWNGSAWSLLTGGAGGENHGVWCADANNIWVVGGEIGSISSIVKWNGLSWEPQNHPNVYRLRAVWGANANDIWAAGELGAVLHWNGSNWTKFTTGTTRTLYGIWGADANNVWIVGDYNTILKWNGSTLTLDDPPGVSLYAVWGSSVNDVWAVGYDSAIKHWNGSTWSYVLAPAQSDYCAVGGSGPNNFWVGGTSGKRYRWNGSSWDNQTPATGDILLGIWSTPQGNAFCVGTTGRIERWNGLSWINESLAAGNYCFGVGGVNRSLVYVAAQGKILTNAPYFPATTTQAATNVTASSAVLNGTVNPGGGTTTAQFDYGPTAGFGSSVPITLSPNDGSTAQNVSATATGLAPGTFYVFRTSATNAFGTGVGANQGFTTLDASDIAIEQPSGTGLQDGVSTVAFGNVLTGGSSQKTFTIRNTGNLALTGIAVSSDGTNAADFVVGSPGATSLAPGANTTFTVTFNATTAGNRTAALHVTSNDPDESPFDIALTGSSTTPEIAVEHPAGTDLGDNGAAQAYGNVTLGTNSVKTFTVRNVGTSALTISAINKDGTNSAEFTVGTPTSTNIAAGGSMTFDVTFAPTALGTRTAAVHIVSDDADENPFDLNLTGVGTGPEITVEFPVGTGLTDNVTVVPFGSTPLGTPVAKICVVKNSGNATLNLTGVTVDGTNASDFSIGSLSTSSVGPAGSATFTVTFNPATIGAKTAAIHIGSNDLDENPFDVPLTGTGTAPEITVEQPSGTNQVDGVTLDYGTVTVGSPVVKTFTVRNSGNSTLTLGTVTKDGTNPAEFAVGAYGSSSLAGGASTTFTVTFTPTSIGAKTAAIHMPNNDADENPFDINFTGVATGPEIGVEQPAGTLVSDGGAGVPFGSTPMGTPVVKVFTIRNTGDQDLTLGAFTKGGSNPGDFTIGTPGATTLATGASTTFDVTFNTFTPGTRNATLQIASNDADENPYDIALTGSGTGPEIAVEQPSGTGLTDGSSAVAWGAQTVGATPVVKTFTIRNNGTVALTGLAVTVDGANAADFTASAVGASSLNAAATTTFTVTFNPATTGFKTAALHVASNDVDENPFDINLTGSGTLASVNWRVAGANADGRPLERVWFADANNGWAVGGNTLNYGAIRYTTDGGVNWNSQLSSAAAGTMDLKAVWGANTSNVWAVGGSGLPSAIIMKWNGSSWSTQTSGGNDFYGVWGTDANNVWAVGLSGRVSKWNGSSWATQTSNTSQALVAVWGLDANNVWAAGTNGTIVKYNGTTWTVQTTGTLTTQTLRTVWGTDANNIWAAGDSGAFLKYNGTTWAAATSFGSTVYSLGGIDTTNVWGVGSSGVIRKWNGTTWTTQTSGTTQSLHGNLHVNATTGWAVGESGAILKWNGTAWSTTSVSQGISFHTRSIWGIDADNVWTCGDNGVIYKGNAITGWTTQTSGVTANLNGVWAADATNQWAVGAGGNIRKGNGTSTWTTQTSGTTNALFGVHGINATNIWAVGASGTILKGNGTTWAAQTSGVPSTQLNAVHAIDATNQWVVGAGGVIRKGDGTNWTGQTSGTSNALNDVWGTDVNNLWSVGVSGTILKWNGSAWSVKTSGTTSDLNSIWGTDSANLWAGGLNGLLLKSNDGGETWVADNSNTTATINAVWGAGAAVFAAGNTGVIMTNIGYPPLPTTLAATNITAYGATLNASVHPEGLATTAKFQHGLTTSYGTDTIVTLSPDNGAAFQNVSTVLGNLASNTTYHFRISTTNSGGTATGADLTFTTLATAEIAVEQPVNTPLADGTSTVVFGSTAVGTPVVKTFTIRNTGNATLNLTGITKDGTHASDFTVGSLGSSTLAPAASTTFDVTFNPALSGAKTAAIHIGSNDLTENPFDISLSGSGAGNGPEIVVEQPAGTPLTDNASTIAFGTTNVGGPIVRTVIIRNTGTENLNLSGVTTDGTDATQFSIGTLISSTVVPGASATFDVTFNPTTTGGKAAAIHIASDDVDENPFDIAVTGTATSPEIVVEQPVGNNLQDGSASVTYASIPAGTSSSKTFTIRNTGSSNLTLGTIARDGSNASEFSVGSLSASTVAPGNSVTFDVTFNPTSAGGKAAAIRIPSNDLDENPFDIDLSGTATPPAPEIAIEQPSGTGLTDEVSAVAYGNVLVGSGSSKTFTIRNLGSATLTGISISKDGTNADLFTVGSPGSTTLAAGASTTFQVTFSPIAVASASAAIHVTSNDADENPFDIALTGDGVAPEIAVEQPAGTGLTDNVSTVNCGSAVLNTAATARTFTIKNTGTGDLTGISVSKNGTDQGDFAINTAGMLTTVPAGQSTTFTVIFTPTAAGARSAAIHVASNDSDENPFDIALTGTGLVAEIAVEQPAGTGLTDNVSSISCGSSALGTPAAAVTFTIKNEGTGDLSGIGVTKDGANASEFAVNTAGMLATLTPGQSTTFTVTFTPAAGGARAAAIHIASNDADENPFDIALTGTGLAPEIAVEQPAGTNLTDNASTISFGSTITAATSFAKTFTIKNIGAANLTGVAVTKDGTNSSEFTVNTTGTTSTVAAGGSTTFTVTFTPTTTGTRAAALHIASNDSDENPFDIALTGDGVSPIQIAQEAYLKASNPSTTGDFGASVAVSGDTVVVGAFLEDTTATDSGAVYVFVRSGGSWVQQAMLKASNPGNNDQFGEMVSISGDTIVVGALFEDSSTTTLPANESATDSGAAYVFVRNSGVWTQQAYLKQSVPHAGDRFGHAVGISADIIAVGAYLEDTTASDSGAVYIYTRTGTTWSAPVVLKSTSIHTSDQFGNSLGISGDTLVVGEFGEDSTASDSGAAFVFKLTSGTWTQQAFLKPSNPGASNLYGFATAIDGDTVVVSSHLDDTSGANSGAAFVYKRTGSTWAQEAFLKASNVEAGDTFGRNVAVSGDTVLIGANVEDGSGLGVNPANNNSSTDAGAAYVFTRTAGTWTQQAYLKPAAVGTTQAGDNFGYYVGLSGGTAVVGAFSEDSNTSGVNSTANELLSSAGAAYIITGVGSADINVEQPVGTPLVDNSGTNAFGSVATGSSSAARTFTVTNVGAGPLLGLNLAIDGTNATDFSANTTGMATTLAAGGSTTFTVTFTPGATGSRAAALHLTSNDPDESSFDINVSGTGLLPVPEIAVEQPAGTNLDDNSSTVAFGSTPSGTPVVKTFIIRNTGTGTLTIGSITKDGTDASDFTMGTPLSSSLAPAASTTFDVTFNGTGFGSRSAAIHIANNDSDENPFDIALTATVTSPEIAIEQPVSTDLTDGVAAIDFGTVNVAASSAKTFTIRNLGNSALSGLAVTIDGANAADYQIDQPLVSSLAGGTSTTFNVTFNPLTPGLKSAAIHVASNDGNENPFDIALTGNAAGAEIGVEQPAGTDLTDGNSTVSFGSTPTGYAVQKTFTIRNTGTVNLTGLTPSLDGPDASSFEIGALGQATLTPGSSTTLVVGFNPATIGAKSAALHLASNDADENPFDIALSGTGTTPVPEIVVEQPAGIDLVDNVSSVSFGSTPAGTPVVKTFTIRNTGSAALNLNAIIGKDGANAADFTVGSPASLTLAPGASTTFDVTFNGIGFGSRAAAIHIASNDSDENPFDVDLAATVTSPEIAIEQPAGTNLTDGLSTLAFGPLPVSDSLTKTFTIRNTGNVDLTGLAVTINGADATDFDISQPVLSSLTPGASTTFDVAFNPGSVGDKAAVIHVASNDGDENPFDIALTGSGTLVVENWREEYFGTSSNTGDAANLADPDHDGLSNLIEFGFGLNPTDSSSLALPQPVLDEGDFVVSFEEPAGITGITYGAEYATEFMDLWLPIPDTGVGRMHVFSVPADEAEKIFIRLVVIGQ